MLLDDDDEDDGVDHYGDYGGFGSSSSGRRKKKKKQGRAGRPGFQRERERGSKLPFFQFFEPICVTMQMCKDLNAIAKLV